MSQQVLDTTIPGDPLKVGGDKINANFTELYADAAAKAAAIALLAPLVSPDFTGTPTAPTAAPGSATQQLANTAFVQAAVAALVNSAPATLDTLQELAAALGNDANFATSMATALAARAGLGLNNVFTKAQTVAPYVNATAAGPLALDAQSSNAFELTLTGNLTLQNPTGPAAGQQITIRLKQDGIGSRTITWPAKFKFSGGAPVLSTAIGAVDLLSGYYCAADDRWECAVVKGLA